ncbi:ABC transporter permease [Natronomonas gomsonensis]|uniref:ABC transporter permease n=1 Tax=Natronomonas gomsonensis TaxID=1046043 RepID=UPI0015BCD8A5|nr:ABC transporter permease [Natronomonas gomsonensis]
MPPDRMPTFEPRESSDDRHLSAPLATLFAGLGTVTALYLYDRYLPGAYLVFGWSVERLEWLFLLSVAVVLAIAVSVAGNRRRSLRVWRRFRRDTGAVVALVVLLAILLSGLFGPFVRPTSHNLLHSTQPPLFASVPTSAVTDCVGPVAEGRCHGSLRYPLGTDHFGRDVLALVFSGARIATMLSFIAVGLVVPLATLIGLVSGYRGGRVDDALVTGIDAQQTLPAVIVYILLASLSSRSLAMFVALFAVFSWGSAARLVRSETRQRSEMGYVLAARNLGADTGHLLRRHLLPNVSNAVVTATAHLVPVLVLTEAAIAYLSLTNPDLLSWGRTVAVATDPELAPIWEQWWVAPPAVVTLAAMVVACKVVGDGLRDALDPRGGR